MDGWMNDMQFYVLYKDDVRLIMQGCVQWNSVYG